MAQRNAPCCPDVEEFLKTILVRSVLAPFMIHELFLSLTETASGSHPCCVVSVTYDRTSFHGGNTGSNPVGDAIKINKLQNYSLALYVMYTS